jgi:hypothetical protein
VGGSGRGERRGGDERPDPGADTRDASVKTARADTAQAGTVQAGTVQAGTVSDAVEELYGAAPETFTERRQALAAAAKAAGDKRAAAAIAALRKPTRAAWVVNRLARADPDAPARLTALAAGLRAAEQAKDGPRLRELSAERGALIDALTAAALAAADVGDPPTSLREEVAATLTAALADPATGAEFAAGTLTKAAHWSGFGAFGLAPADDVSAGGSASGAANSGPADGAGTSARSISSSGGSVSAIDRSGSGSPRRGGRDAAPAAPDELAARRAAAQRAAQERRAAEAEQRLAREAAERAAERRENYEEMERTVASAAAAAAEAGSTEERLEGEVRDLEERLIQARADLAKARLRARHAEAAERRARQALGRLPRP